MSALDHDAIRALCDAATDGPWTTEESSSLDPDRAAVGRHVSGIWNAAGVPVASFAEPWPDGPDAKFTAAARTVVPQLLDELEHVSATANMRAGQIKALRDQTDKLTADHDAALSEVDRLTAENNRLFSENQSLGYQIRQDTARITELNREVVSAKRVGEEFRQGWLLRGRQVNEGRCCNRAELAEARSARAADPHAHACVACSPDGILPGPGCINCRHTGMDQTPCNAPGHQPQCPHGCCGGPRKPLAGTVVLNPPISDIPAPHVSHNDNTRSPRD